MRDTTHIVLLRFSLLLLFVLAWLECLFRLSTGMSAMSYPRLLSILAILLLVSCVTVVFASQWWAKLIFRPRAIGGADQAFAHVVRILQRQATTLNVSPPVLYVYDSVSLNAFIVGGIWHQQHLYMSESLLRQLSQEEVGAVIAHELAHIYHRDVVVNEIFFGMGLACQFLLQHTVGRLLAHLARRNDNGESAKTIASVITYGGLLLPLGLLMLVYSRRSEYRADALACQIVGQQEFLWLLHRLNGVCRDSVFNLDEQELLWRDYFSSHPPIGQRITALETRQQT